MRTVAVIAEFNPPHNGHKYLCDAIRAAYGPDTAVIAIMSGNFVQRGDFALTDAYTRSHMALSLGVNLILELPFPYSMASAADYARAGVAIVDALGCVDTLCFGSECGSLETLRRIANEIDAEDFQNELAALRATSSFRSLGYAELRTRLLRRRLGEEYASSAEQPNNILAIEYLRALRTTAHSIDAMTVSRRGDYSATVPENDYIASASAIRNLISGQNEGSWRKYMTSQAAEILSVALADGTCPASPDRLSSSILTHLRQVTAQDGEPVLTADCDASLWARLTAALPRAATYQQLITLVKARHYTDAHIRRAILFAYFGVTSSEIRQAPLYTRLLASDTVGRDLLKIIKRSGTFPVLTKPADYRVVLSADAQKRAEKAAFADSVYLLAIPTPQSAAEVCKKTPWVE